MNELKGQVLFFMSSIEKSSRFCFALQFFHVSRLRIGVGLHIDLKRVRFVLQNERTSCLFVTVFDCLHRAHGIIRKMHYKNK